MATDEAIFRCFTKQKSRPTLRLYGWTAPSVSLGYFQDIAGNIDLEFCRQSGIKIVRRLTGGKAVLHDEELTYAVIARDNTPPFTPDLLETYRIISRCLSAGLMKLGIGAGLADRPRTSSENTIKAVCFSRSSQHELTVGGKKICGSAQHRSQGIFLQHGSLLMGFNPQKTLAVMDRSIQRESVLSELKQSVTSIGEQTKMAPAIANLCSALTEAFVDTLKVKMIPGALTPEEEAMKTHLLHHKYGTDAWNLERKLSEKEKTKF